ncbi:MAG: CHAD domain-containing protein [Planctomycetota bacterium]|nr:CHAD domain-containing protein [Planctomycetota bacterium]
MESSDHTFPLMNYLDELVEDLRKLIAPALRGEDVDAVHDARVATRRLKAATDLLGPVVSARCKKPFAKVTRTLRKQLGPLRDLDVMLDHLGEIKPAKYARAVDWLKEHFIQCRQQVVKDAKDEVPPSRMLSRLGSWWGLRQEIADAEDAVSSLLAESVHLRLDAFAEQAVELIRTRSGPGDKERRVDPHQLRIAGKSLRYTLEMAREQGAKLPKPITALFKRMQEWLGLWHDYVVLAERMLQEVVECDLALHDTDLVAQILSLAETMLRKGQVHLKKVADAWTQHGEELSSQLRAAFPLTKIVEQPQPLEIAAPIESISSANAAPAT